MIEVNGRSYDAETVGKAMLDVLYERAPVGIMSSWEMRDAILARFRWASGTISMVSVHDDAGADVREAAAAAEIHLEQTLAMFRELLKREIGEFGSDEAERRLTGMSEGEGSE